VGEGSYSSETDVLYSSCLNFSCFAKITTTATTNTVSCRSFSCTAITRIVVVNLKLTEECVKTAYFDFA